MSVKFVDMRPLYRTVKYIGPIWGAYRRHYTLFFWKGKLEESSGKDSKENSKENVTENALETAGG